MRYFIRTADADEGPFKLGQLRGWIREGQITRATLIRRENRETWEPIGDVLRRRARKRAARAAEEESAEDAPAASEDEGSFLLGFIGGLLGGCIVLALFLRRGKPKTRQGVYWGFGFQAVIGLAMSAQE